MRASRPSIIASSPNASLIRPTVRGAQNRVDGELRTELTRAAAGTVKRVYAPRGTPDFTAPPGTGRLRAFLETKTVWHPTGAVSLAGGGSY